MASSRHQSDLESFLQCGDQWPRYNSYKELDKTRKEIRILRIWSPTDTQDLHGSLEHVDLELSPIFDALSYYWGPPDEQRPIMMDGEVVMIAKNLHSFLTALCNLGQELPVWVDSLCIQQADVKERNRQVTMMGDIYRSAARVHAWIGDPDADSNFALDYVKHFSEGALPRNEHPARLRNRAVQAFRVAAARPYWERIWVAQEVALASEVLIASGSRRVQWDDFMAAMNHIVDSGSQTEEAPAERNITYIKRLNDLRSTDQNQTLIELAASFADHSSTDPKDKIYALYGLVKQCLSPYPPVDYTKSVLDLYFEVLLSILPYSPSCTDESVPSELAEKARIVLKGLSIPLVELASDLREFFHGSVRIPVASLALGDYSKHPCGDGYISDPEGFEFIPRHAHISLQTGDMVHCIGFTHRLIVRNEPLTRRQKIVGLLEVRDFDDHAQKKNSFQSMIRTISTELCPLRDFTAQGNIRTIYAHTCRAALLLQILRPTRAHLGDSFSARFLGTARTLFEAVCRMEYDRASGTSHLHRLCTCSLGTSSEGSPTLADHESNMAWLKEHIDGLRTKWFNDLKEMGQERPRTWRELERCYNVWDKPKIPPLITCGQHSLMHPRS